jgi:[calcium/calmodulin-dependent protein kinase] kinase
MASHVEEVVEPDWDAVITDEVEWCETRANAFCIGRHLGNGSFGRVVQCERRVGAPPFREFALKIYSRARLRKHHRFAHDPLTGRLAAITGERKVAAEVGTREVSHLRSLYRSLASCPARQVEIMRRLWHRNIILLFEVLDDTSAESIGLVMEFCSGGCSMSYDEADRRFVSSATGGVLPEPLAAQYFDGIARGLLYLRDRCIAHRDIKPENLLLTEDGTIRIADFGCARCFARDPAAVTVEQTDDAPPEASGDGFVCDTAGTYYFLSPEACSGESYSAYDADAWALCITLFCFVFGFLPFDDEGVGPLMDQIKTQPLPLPQPLPDDGPSHLLSLLTAALAKDPKSRLTLSQLSAHQWLQEHSMHGDGSGASVP